MNNQQELKDNYNFERKKHFEFFLPFYREKNWQVIKDNIDGNFKIDWDVELEVSTGEYRLVDEKARKKDYGDCLVEIIQDLKTGSLGWLFGKEEWVFYGSWNDIENIYPSSLYLIKMIELKKYIWSLKGILRIIVSMKGWGITWNIVLSWNELIKNKIVKKYI